MMINKRLSLLFTFIIAFITLTYGWGKVGHEIIVEVAKARLSNPIKDSVEKYLGGMSWEAASTWMDDVRKDHQYDNMKHWHYVNIDKDKSYNANISKGNNVVQQLQNAIKNLKNKSKLTPAEISFNLKVLIHLIGDIHQPLHVGYGKDKGGNDTHVILNGKMINLHHLWDTDIIKVKKISLAVIQDKLRNMPNEKIDKLANTDVLEWLNQSRNYLDAVYSFTDPINDLYINKSASIIETQLMYAGIRLSAILNEVFKKLK